MITISLTILSLYTIILGAVVLTLYLNHPSNKFLTVTLSILATPVMLAVILVRDQYGIL